MSTGVSSEGAGEVRDHTSSETRQKKKHATTRESMIIHFGVAFDPSPFAHKRALFSTCPASITHLKVMRHSYSTAPQTVCLRKKCFTYTLLF